MFKILLTLLQVIRLIPMSEQDKNETQEEAKPSKGRNKSKVNYLDDLLLAVFLFPVVGAFLPWTRDAVRAGLELIKEIPDWFSFIIVLIVISAFGLRRYVVDIIERLINRPK